MCAECAECAEFSKQLKAVASGDPRPVLRGADVFEDGESFGVCVAGHHAEYIGGGGGVT